MSQKVYFTKNNGEWVDESYARRRLVACDELRFLSLEMRQRVADRIVNNPGNNGLLVSYLCHNAFDTYLDVCIEKLEPEKHKGEI